MDDVGLTEQIALLEERIEDYAGTLERCRKIIVLSKLAIGAGIALILLVLLGVVGFSPAAVLAGITAIIGGVVVFGSNTATMQQTMAALQLAEADRARLIGMIHLRVVGETIH